MTAQPATDDGVVLVDRGLTSPGYTDLVVDVHKPEIDTNTYRAIRLENGVEVLLVSNPVFTTASCSVAVNVGSFNEPEKWLGIAHFLEHMLFMGTEKYPGENEFQKFLSLHNGYSNAYTADDMTVYYAVINSECFSKMVDMLAWFFIKPLFIADSVEREISAVDSEFLNSKNNASARILPLLALFNTPGDLRGRFSYGNSETLRKDGILEAVIDFWKRNYSCDGMKVVLCSNHSVSEMKELAAVFSKIGPKVGELDVPATNFSPFDPAKLGTVLHILPLDSRKNLIVFLDAPSSLPHFKKNLYSFVEFILCTKETGGITSALKDLGLATDIHMEWDVYSDYTRIKLTVELTDKGVEEWKAVASNMAMFFEKLKNGCNRLCYEYERFRKLQTNYFRYSQQGSPIEITETLSATLQKYPIENALNWPFVCEGYDPLLLSEILELFSSPGNWIILLSSKSDVPGYYDMTEQYYELKYKVIDKIETKEEMVAEELKQREPAEIAEHSCVSLFRPDNSTRFIERLSGPNGACTLLFDSEFQVPKAEVFILLCFSFSNNKYSRIHLYNILVEESFQESNARKLTDSQVSFSVNTVCQGSLVKLEGFSTSISDIAESFVEKLAEFNMKRFDILKEEATHSLEKQLKKSPYFRICDVFKREVAHLPTLEEDIEVTSATKPEDLIFPSEFSVDVLTVGNISWADTLRIFKSFSQKAANKKELTAVKDWKNLPEKIIFRTYDSENTAVGVIYQMSTYEPSSSFMKQAATGRLIRQIASEDFFNELRTEEELGYLVGVNMYKILNSEYLVFMVQSTKDAEFLVNRILTFVQKLKEQIEHMDAEEFEMHKESVVGEFEEPIVNLDELSSFAWKQYEVGGVSLDYNSRMVEEIKKLERGDVLDSGILDSYVVVLSEFSE